MPSGCQDGADAVVMSVSKPKVEMSFHSKDTVSTFVPEWDGDSDDLLHKSATRTVTWRITLPLRCPVLRFCELSSDEYVNIIALPHNGLRCEVVDLYRIIWALGLKHLHWRDLDSFSSRWNIFFGVSADLLHVQEDVLFPYANFACHEPLHFLSRQIFRRQVLQTGFEVSALLNRTKPQNFQEVCPLIINGLDSYVVSLMRYFDETERKLPTWLRRSVEAEKLCRLSQILIEELAECEYGYYALPLFTRNLTADQQRRYRRMTFGRLSRRSEREFAVWWAHVLHAHARQMETVMDGLSDDVLALCDDHGVSPDFAGRGRSFDRADSEDEAALAAAKAAVAEMSARQTTMSSFASAVPRQGARKVLAAVRAVTSVHRRQASSGEAVV